VIRLHPKELVVEAIETYARETLALDTYVGAQWSKTDDIYDKFLVELCSS